MGVPAAGQPRYRRRASGLTPGDWREKGHLGPWVQRRIGLAQHLVERHAHGLAGLDVVVAGEKDLVGDDGNVAHLVLDEGETLAGDLFVDCSGFRSVIAQGALGVPFVSYADTLFNGSGRDVIGLRAMMSGSRWERMSDEERMEAVRDMQKTAKKQVLTELVRRKKEAGEIR